MTISGRHIRDGASLVVNGRKVPGTIRTDEEDKVMVKLKTLPSVGIHFLQVQNPNGLFSNDFIFNVVASEEKARRLKYERSSSFPRDNLAKAIEKGDLNETRKLLYRGAPLNSRRIGNGGMTPLSTAVFHGRYEIVKYLVERRKASVSHHNRDGNTPLHLAAFLGRMETVKYLLEKGASVTKKNDRKDTAIDIVSSSWNGRLARRYTSLSDEDDLNLDLEEIKRLRPQIAKLLNARK
jgi:ankyrin repeat protein